MRNYLLLLLLSLNGIIGFAQSSKGFVSVSGKVVDETNVPVHFANVALYKSEDSSLVAGVTSNEKGKFVIETGPGFFYLKITFLTLSDKIIPDVEVGVDKLLLGTIVLKAGTIDLDEVQIEGQVMQMELKLDKRVFNVQSDINNRGRNASEILDNIPSVEVDVEGKVSLRGSENVRILIDGKPSTLVGATSTDALRLLQGTMIDKIEVITNPSARYEAEGEVGIINIILKKEKREGVNGTFELHTGYPHNHGGSFSLNFRKKYFNLFSSYALNFNQRPGSGSSNIDFTYPDTTFSYDRDRQHERGGISHNLRFGSDIFLNKKNTLTVSGLYKNSTGNNEAVLTYIDFNEQGDQVRTVLRNEDEKENEEDIEANLSYNKTFKKKGEKFSFDFKYNRSLDLESSTIVQSSDEIGVNDLQQRTNNTENETNWLFQTDFVYPFLKDGKFETGARINLREIDNDYGVEEQDENGTWNPLPLFNNHMIYTENIYATYVMAGNKSGKLSYQAGLRMEYSDVTTELLETDEKNPRTYLSFFPSAHFSYELKDQLFLQLSYSRRISRPSFWSLLPFFGYSDSRNFYSGNPNLDPEFTHSFEIGTMKRWTKGSILGTFYYRYTAGIQERILLADSLGNTLMFPVNLGFEHSGGLELSGNWEFYKWWSMTASTNFFRAIRRGDYEGVNYDSDTWGWTANLSTKIKVKKKVNVQPSLRYRSPRNSAQGKSLSMTMLDIGANMDILKGNGTLTFTISDVFNSRKRRYETVTDEFYQTGEFQWRSRQLLLSFNYRLNQKKKRGGGRGGYGG